MLTCGTFTLTCPCAQYMQTQLPTFDSPRHAMLTSKAVEGVHKCCLQKEAEEQTVGLPSLEPPQAGGSIIPKTTNVEKNVKYCNDINRVEE